MTQSLPVVCPDEEQETPSPMRSRLHQETNDNSIDHSGSSAPGAIDLKPESKSFWKEAFAIDEQQNKLRRKTEIGPQEMVDKMEKIIDEKNSDIDKLRTTSNRLIGEISRIQSDLNSKCLELDTTRKETAQVESKLLEQLEDTKTRLKVANAHYEQEKRDHHRIQEEMEAANKETSAKLKRTSDVLTKWQESHRQIKHQYETTTAELKCIHDDSRNNYIDVRKELQITSRNLELTRAEMNTKDREFQQMKAEMNTKDREFQQIKAKMNTNDQEFQQMTAEFNRLRLRRVELYCTQQQLKDARVQIKALEEDLARKTTETPGSLGAPEEDDEIGDHDLGRNTDLQCPMEPVQEAPQKDGEDDLDQESDAARDSVLTESFPVEAPMHSEATQSHLVEGSDD
ncbi:hypothetical protein KJ359_007138 [Pestalotiopsis sp. 9143b]|nr:hypothetical protein KJ359_007138 [Pestalotiopsis sp. 9143b]